MTCAAHTQSSTEHPTAPIHHTSTTEKTTTMISNAYANLISISVWMCGAGGFFLALLLPLSRSLCGVLRFLIGLFFAQWPDRPIVDATNDDRFFYTVFVVNLIASTQFRRSAFFLYLSTTRWSRLCRQMSIRKGLASRALGRSSSILHKIGCWCFSFMYGRGIESIVGDRDHMRAHHESVEHKPLSTQRCAFE